MSLTIDSDIRYVKGVGEKRAQLFGKLGAGSVGALLRLYPRSYEDWSRPYSIAQAPFNEVCCVKATVAAPVKEHRIRAGMVLYRTQATDGESLLQITLFNNRFAASALQEGEAYLFFGKITGTARKREMSAPEIRRASVGQGIHPVYPQTQGLSTKMIEMAVGQAFRGLGDSLADPLPTPLRQAYSLCHLRYALENVHFPESYEALAIARQRLIFEELLTLQLGLLRLRMGTVVKTNLVLGKDESEPFFSLLPFSPTGAQRRAVEEAVRDMKSGKAMNRLLQGDVGSGKTAVAAALCYCAVKNGWQAAMMAPTEILAGQHYRSLSGLLAPAGVRVALLTGSTKAAEKRKIREALAAGEIGLLVGTHSLLQEEVRFSRLGLVVTDEQHRFGVEQRAVLAAKGEQVHMLVMSATPIPRTLALIIYGDLDISVLDELPPGRRQVQTLVMGTGKRERVYAFLKKEMDAGRQAYIVCPLVEEGDGGLTSAEQYAKTLKEGPFSAYSVGLLHGKLKPKQKEQVMAQFQEGSLSLLVATTVIEVGVDVPNATVMVIENAERFGLSQLHQLRGRVGRGKEQSYCILISDARNEAAVRRLKAMRSTSDGFRIADEDLKLRGPGDFFGQRQHGLPELRIADMAEDVEVLRSAQAAARGILQLDPSLSAPEHEGLRRAVEALFDSVGERGLN